MWLKKEMPVSSCCIAEIINLTLNDASSSLIPCMVVALSFNRQFCDTSAYKKVY